VQQWGTSSFDNAYGVGVDSNHNVYATGNADGEAFLDQYSAAGAFQWGLTFNSGTNPALISEGNTPGTAAYGIAIDGSNHIYITGDTDGTFTGNTSAGGTDAFLASFDATGSNQWTRQFGTTVTDSGSGVAVDGSGNIDVVGYTNGLFAGQTTLGVPGNYDAFLVSFDPQGAMTVQQFGTSNTDYANSVAVDSSNNVYITGYTFGTFPGQTAVGNGGNLYLAEMQP
jgi:hypothetical protein